VMKDASLILIVLLHRALVIRVSKSEPINPRLGQIRKRNDGEYDIRSTKKELENWVSSTALLKLTVI
jgi:hypothetical protein